MGGGLVVLSKLDEMGRLVAWVLPPLAQAPEEAGTLATEEAGTLVLTLLAYGYTSTRLLVQTSGRQWERGRLCGWQCVHKCDDACHGEAGRARKHCSSHSSSHR